ncbi:hypothetical protein OE88DRAFT_1655866 [Heliocybe sulcata]|uniref:Uncharacterized protein n=1 Tax=Heliocybe sulcata TaxID=5364 RepID=A0A5C3NJ70_9AGAM|nr:hypothetical protein OE88DRAFT_1655866 [Heliocybe sulcata]
MRRHIYGIAALTWAATALAGPMSSASPTLHSSMSAVSPTPSCTDSESIICYSSPDNAIVYDRRDHTKPDRDAPHPGSPFDSPHQSHSKRAAVGAPTHAPTSSASSPSLLFPSHQGHSNMKEREAEASSASSTSSSSPSGATPSNLLGLNSAHTSHSKRSHDASSTRGTATGSSSGVGPSNILGLNSAHTSHSKRSHDASSTRGTATGSSSGVGPSNILDLNGAHTSHVKRSHDASSTRGTATGSSSGVGPSNILGLNDAHTSHSKRTYEASSARASSSSLPGPLEAFLDVGSGRRNHSQAQTTASPRPGKRENLQEDARPRPHQSSHSQRPPASSSSVPGAALTMAGDVVAEPSPRPTAAPRDVQKNDARSSSSTRSVSSGVPGIIAKRDDGRRNTDQRSSSSASAHRSPYSPSASPPAGIVPLASPTGASKRDVTAMLPSHHGQAPPDASQIRAAMQPSFSPPSVPMPTAKDKFEKAPSSSASPAPGGLLPLVKRGMVLPVPLAESSHTSSRHSSSMTVAAKRGAGGLPLQVGPKGSATPGSVMMADFASSSTSHSTTGASALPTPSLLIREPGISLSTSFSTHNSVPRSVALPISHNFSTHHLPTHTPVPRQVHNADYSHGNGTTPAQAQAQSTGSPATEKRGMRMAGSLPSTQNRAPYVQPGSKGGDADTGKRSEDTGMPASASDVSGKAKGAARGAAAAKGM